MIQVDKLATNYDVGTIKNLTMTKICTYRRKNTPFIIGKEPDPELVYADKTKQGYFLSELVKEDLFCCNNNGKQSQCLQFKKLDHRFELLSRYTPSHWF